VPPDRFVPFPHRLVRTDLVKQIGKIRGLEKQLYFMGILSKEK
jgi:hypothetical protein